MSETGQSPNWDSLKGIWQDGPEIDLIKLFRRARFSWWRVRLTLFMNMMICISGEIACVYVLYKNISLAANVFGIVGLVFCWVTAWFSFKHLKSSLGDMSNEPEKLLELQIKQLKGLIELAKFNIKMTYFGIALSAGAFWMFYDKHGSLIPNDDMTNTEIFMNGFLWGIPIGILLCPFIYGQFIKRKTKELTDIEASLAAMKAAG
jgi:hypothetical protein